MSPMHSEATTAPSTAPAAPARAVTRLQAELTAVRRELDTVGAERDHLRGVLADLLAEQVQLRAQLAQTQAQLAALDAERHDLHQELVDLKRKPFTSRQQRDDSSPAKPRGRPLGHAGSSRPRPTLIDRTQAIPAPDTCPDCGTAFTGTGVIRERVVEDIVLVRPTVITKYVIERRWCPNCRTYHEDAVTDALPRHRLGLHVLLFVVYQKVALGLSYGKIQHELRTYFGLTVSVGELPGMVAEIAALFGPAYARLLHLMRLSAAIHIDETSWRVDGVAHWLWVFVNDVVALYVVSRSRGSKVPQALLGPDFDGVVEATSRAPTRHWRSQKRNAGRICCVTPTTTPKARTPTASACASIIGCTRCFWRWAWRSNRCRPTRVDGRGSTTSCERSSGASRATTIVPGNVNNWPNESRNIWMIWSSG